MAFCETLHDALPNECLYDMLVALVCHVVVASMEKKNIASKKIHKNRILVWLRVIYDHISHIIWGDVRRSRRVLGATESLAHAQHSRPYMQ